MIRIKVDETSPEDVAVGALGYLAEDPVRLSRFLDVTGLDPAAIRRAAADDRFLASVLAYVMSDEPLVLGLAASRGWAPETVGRAHERLTGRQA